MIWPEFPPSRPRPGEAELEAGERTQDDELVFPRKVTTDPDSESD